MASCPLVKACITRTCEADTAHTLACSLWHRCIVHLCMSHMFFFFLYCVPHVLKYGSHNSKVADESWSTNTVLFPFIVLQYMVKSPAPFQSTMKTSIAILRMVFTVVPWPPWLARLCSSLSTLRSLFLFIFYAFPHVFFRLEVAKASTVADRVCL